MSGTAHATPHDVLMDQVYRYQRHIYDFTRKYYLFGRDRLIDELGARPGQRILEIGCGTARNLIRAAQKYPGTSLYGLDASQAMLDTAAAHIARHQVAHRIHLAHGFAENVSPAMFGLDQPFDHAIFSYSLSMIPDWRGALTAAAKATAPNGLIHIVDFGDLEGLPSPAAKALRAWLRIFHVAPRAELLDHIETSGTAKGLQSLHLLMGRYAFIVKANPLFSL